MESTQEGLFYDGPNRMIGKVVSILSRSGMTLFIHATTGHNNFNYMNSIIIPEYTPLCRFCEEEEKTFDHLYDNDARYKETRLAYRTGRYRLSSTPQSWRTFC